MTSDRLLSPAIIVPIEGESPEALHEKADACLAHGVDVIEWRADSLYAALDAPHARRVAVLVGVCRALAAHCAHTPLLATVRTVEEGGRARLDPEDYADLLAALIRSGGARAVDVQVELVPEHLASLATLCREHGVVSVGSWHNFHSTPTRDEILSRLGFMHESADLDVAKVAVMPQGRLDVLAVLEATAAYSLEHPQRALITMAMGELGNITRSGGHLMGSWATFAALGEASAPGQLPLALMRQLIPRRASAFTTLLTGTR